MKLLLSTSASLLVAAPLLAGSPNNPGAQGEYVHNVQETNRALYTEVENVPSRFGRWRAEQAKNGAVFGKRIQEVMDHPIYDGLPNPDNDNGSGND